MADRFPAFDATQLELAAVQLNAVKYFQVAAFVVLIYDHALTFGEEVEQIWKENLNGASVLFLLNRYATPLQFIIIIDAFQDPRWTRSACNRFVAFQGGSNIALIAICELVMILRVYALWGRCPIILTVLLLLWITQVVVSAVGLSTGFAVPLLPGSVGCIFSGSTTLFAALWVAPLISGSVMFVLTLLKTWHYMAHSSNTRTIQVFLRDGIMYYLVVFMANLMNTFIYFLAVQDIKSIGASFSQVITSVMVSRLVLNLRSAGRVTCNRPTKFMSKTIGNLGEHVYPPHNSSSSDYQTTNIPILDITRYGSRWYNV